MEHEKRPAGTVAGIIILTVTAMIWGCAFAAQDAAAESLNTFTFNALRMAMAVIALGAALPICDRFGLSKAPETKEEWKKTVTAGLICGFCLFIASNLQQFGLELGTDSGKAGFITALYIVLVPVAGIFFKKKTAPLLWVGVAVAVVGMYLLCVGEGAFSINTGDLLVFLCACCFTVNIMVVSHFSDSTDGIRVSFIQFAVVAVLSTPFMIFIERPTQEAIRGCLFPLIYAGVFSGGVGYTMQIIGQKYVQPGPASLIMSLESVFAVLSGWVFLGQSLSARELIGCVLMFAAIILAQIEPKKRKK